jgi:hypothetical protein
VATVESLNNPLPSHTSEAGGIGPRPADLSTADSVHVVDNSAPRRTGSATKLPRHIQQRHLHRGLEAAGATRAVIVETEGWLLENRNRLPVLLALHDYDWLVEEGLRTLQFGEKAIPALMAALQDGADVHPQMLMYVDDTVREFLEDPENRAEYDLSDEDVDALNLQLRGLDSLQRLALSRTVDAASDLRHKSSMSAVEACRALGLRVT